MGLRGIEQRVKSFNGEIVITSTYHMGTEVKISFDQKNV